VKYQVTHHDTVEVPGSSPVVPTTPLAGMMPTAGKALSRADVKRVKRTPERPGCSVADMTPEDA